VTKETVPVERVRLATETVTQEQQIQEEVRKERIDEPDVDTSRPEH
jgi:stress response protein YsnF